MTHHSPTHQFLPGLSAGLVIGLITVTVGISFAALIFKGDVAPYLPNAIGLILLAVIPAILLTTLFSSFPGAVSIMQDAPAAILAVMAASILQSMPLTAPFQEKFITVAVAVMLASLLTGLTFILLGQFKSGALVRFLPYPVIGGFLAGTGWLLLIGGIGVLSNLPTNLANWAVFFQPEVLVHWAPGVVLASIMLGFMNRFSHFLVLPGMLLGILALFYAVIFLARIPISVVSQQGWLLGPFPNAGLWQPLNPSDLARVHWGAVLAQAGSLASIMLISAVSLLLNASAIELVAHRDLDLNRELRVLGLANIISGLLGGLISYHALSVTVINQKIARGNRGTGWVAAGVCALPFLFGTQFLSYIPRLVLGTLLVLLGFSFLFEWVILAWTKFSRVEYGVILVILIVIAALGYLQGVGVGIVAAVGLFVISYSQVSVTRHALSGLERQSRFTRSLLQRNALLEHGAETYILELQGFIFFGTANHLLEEVRQRIDRPGCLPPHFVILDFAEVNGLDSTAMLSFSKMKQVLHSHGIKLLVSGLSESISRRFASSGIVSQEEDWVKQYPDLDHGLEWVENQILQSADISCEPPQQTLKEIFCELLPDPDELTHLFTFLEKREIKTGAYLMHQDEPPDHIYFIESGQVTAWLEAADQPPVRLETMRSGRMVGELGFYLRQKRTAAVVVDEPGTAYLLTAENLAKMEKEAPDTALYFHRLLILLLAERTTHLIRVVAALEK